MDDAGNMRRLPRTHRAGEGGGQHGQRYVLTQNGSTTFKKGLARNPLRLVTASSAHLPGMRTMFISYGVFILAVLAFCFYVGIANR
jgi:hypothetical protein